MFLLLRRTPLLLVTLSSFTFACAGQLFAAPVRLVDEAPASIGTSKSGLVLVDYGKVAFGNLRITPPAGANATITIHFGEAFTDGSVNRKPPGTVRYASATFTMKDGEVFTASPAADKRNTEQVSASHPPAVLTPPEWGVVLPFRWVEIEGWPGELKAGQITRQAAYAVAWDDAAAAFTCSDETLNRIWELCRYSIKATTFAGVYVDGDRERIPYEGDAYLNQLSHYSTGTDLQMARDTFDLLMKHPTWPTEWAPHMVFMAHADWMRTGDKAWLAPRYEALKAKTLLNRAGADGLIRSDAQQIKKTDIVDWPVGERDKFVFTEVNTVVNAFHLRALGELAELASALGKAEEAKDFAARVVATRAKFQEVLFDEKRGIYRDGIGTDHASQHANFFPLAFGVVPADKRQGVVDFLKGQGMRCSVYAAQYLLEALFANEAGAKALELITAEGDRSWKHMLISGTTITWEAWDQKYKPNQDWNHAWGAAPANLLPRFVLGVQPLAAGWKRAVIRPNPGQLSAASGKVPTPRGPVMVEWKNAGSFQISVTLPDRMPARLELPASAESRGVYVDGKPVKAQREGARWILSDDLTGTAKIEVK